MSTSRLSVFRENKSREIFNFYPPAIRSTRTFFKNWPICEIVKTSKVSFSWFGKSSIVKNWWCLMHLIVWGMFNLYNNCSDLQKSNFIPLFHQNHIELEKVNFSHIWDLRTAYTFTLDHVYLRPNRERLPLPLQRNYLKNQVFLKLLPAKDVAT